MKKTQKSAMIDHVLMKMEEHLAQGATKHEVRSFHDQVLKYLRYEKNPIPDWDRFPLSRSFYTQEYP